VVCKIIWRWIIYLCYGLFNDTASITYHIRAGVIYKTGFLDWMIGFIAPYTFTQFGTAGNRALRLLYKLSSSHFFSSRLLATGLSVSLSLQLTHQVFLAQSNSFLAIYSQSPSTAISRTPPNSLPTTVLYSLLLCLYFYYSCPAEHFL
jgi:hypothetical protein